jgi:hypothetical protein
MTTHETRSNLNGRYSELVDGMHVGQTIEIQIERSYVRRTFASWIRAHRLSVVSREKDICTAVCTFVLKKIK